MRWSVVLLVALAACQKADPGPCGDQAVVARFAECKAARDRATCERAGGRWGQRERGPGCSCSTGQAGCPCRSASDCVGECRFETKSCTGPTTCTSSNDSLGCRCRLEPGGGRSSFCAD
jgi:hypothetical protein